MRKENIIRVTIDNVEHNFHYGITLEEILNSLNQEEVKTQSSACLLYTSDAADE